MVRQVKILQVNCVYKKGSTGNIVYDLHKHLQNEGHSSIVCYGRGDKIHEKDVYKTSYEFVAKFNNLKSRFTGLQYNGSFIATRKLINIIKKENPDIVHLHCLNGFFVNIYKLLDFLKTNKYKTILTLHAEFMHTGSCSHAFECEKWKTGCGNCPDLCRATRSYFLDRTHTAWKKMKKAFEGFEDIEIIGVSKWITDRAIISPIMKGLSFSLIYNGINTDSLFYKRESESKKLAVKHNIQDDEKVILHVTPNFNSYIKGGKYFIDLAVRMREEKIKFIIVGFKDANVSIPSNIITVSHTNNQHELAAYYSLSDLFIITSLKDNYPTVCIESISCGTPVVGFDVGGVKETIPNGLGTTVKVGDIDALESAVKEWVNKKDFLNKNDLENARQQNNQKRMVRDYMNIYLSKTSFL